MQLKKQKVDEVEVEEDDLSFIAADEARGISHKELSNAIDEAVLSTYSKDTRDAITKMRQLEQECEDSLIESRLSSMQHAGPPKRK